MGTIKKPPIFFLFLIICSNIFSLVALISNVNAKDLGFFKSYTGSKTFSYSIQIPDTNNSYANRIATENFEYETNTNLSLLNIYRDSEYSLVVKDFNDIDFEATNYTYKSKFGQLTSLTALNNQYEVNYNFMNALSLANCKVKNILTNFSNIAFYYRFTFKDNTFLDIYLDLNSRELFVTDSYSQLYYNDSFVPIYGTYDNLCLEFDKNTSFTNYTISIAIVAYQNNGKIVLKQFMNLDLNQYRNTEVKQFGYGIVTGSVGIKCGFVAFDSNFVADKLNKYQNALLNLNYSANDIKTFYLTKVPFYTTALNNMSVGITTQYLYAKTLYQNRYLNYKTNTTLYNYVLYNRINSNYVGSLSDSFSVLMELSTNNTVYPPILTFLFQKYSFYWYMDSGFNGWNIHINSTSIAFTSNLTNNVIVLAQFKNKVFGFTIFLNNIAHYYEYAINDKFVKLNTQYAQITNVFVASLQSEGLKKYDGYIERSNDIFTFQNRISRISEYCSYVSIINIPDTVTPNVFDTNSVEYSINTYWIYNMQFAIARDSPNGIFSITSNYDYVRPLFVGNNSLIEAFTYNFLNGLHTGNLYISAIFPFSSEPMVTLKINYRYTFIMIYTDHIPSNNLWLAKAFEIFIPLLIIGVIVIGFKSNSDSKYLPIIGMYIAIFTLYLMDYMSLMFMILSMLFLSIGLYIIVKNEKGREI